MSTVEGDLTEADQPHCMNGHLLASWSEDECGACRIEGVRELVSRIMVRGEEDAIKRHSDRLQFLKNTVDLHERPATHMAAVMALISREDSEPLGPSFNTGIMLGVTATLASATEQGRMILDSMLADIRRYQDGEA